MMILYKKQLNSASLHVVLHYNQDDNIINITILNEYDKPKYLSSKKMIEYRFDYWIDRYLVGSKSS